jgi:hypothetical protein
MPSPHYSSSQVQTYIAKAHNAANNALWSIKRAYLPPQPGAPAAFILITCFIDFLGTLYAGTDSKSTTFKDFISDFMRQQHDGVGYNGEDLYSALRNKLVHNYSIWQGKFVLTHGHPEKHLKLHQEQTRILNLETLFEDVEQAANDYFNRVELDPDLQQRLSKRITKVGTIEDITI